MIRWLTDRLLEKGHTRPQYHAVSHSRLGEGEATHRAIEMSRLMDVPILIVHVSTGEATDEIRRAQSAGLKIYGETCPQYLFLTQDDLDREGMEGAKYCCSPPLRDTRHQAALWQGLADGTLGVYSSDHSAFHFDDPEGKMRNGRNAPFNKVPYGLPGLEVRLPLLFSEGVGKGRMTLERFAEVTAATPARLYGLESKGVIAEGFDADLVVWNPKRQVTISTGVLHDGIDYTPYEGVAVTGWPATTIVRGAVVVEDGELRGAPGHGRLMPCARPAAASPSGQPETGFDVVANRFTHW
jgi:dihydropyrimidinase